MSIDLLSAIRKRCRKMEIPLVGVASVEQWKDSHSDPDARGPIGDSNRPACQELWRD